MMRGAIANNCNTKISVPNDRDSDVGLFFIFRRNHAPSYVHIQQYLDFHILAELANCLKQYIQYPNVPKFTNFVSRPD